MIDAFIGILHCASGVLCVHFFSNLRAMNIHRGAFIAFFSTNRKESCIKPYKFLEKFIAKGNLLPIIHTAS